MLLGIAKKFLFVTSGQKLCSTCWKKLQILKRQR